MEDLATLTGENSSISIRIRSGLPPVPWRLLQLLVGTDCAVTSCFHGNVFE
jgi:hypothetical protein